MRAKSPALSIILLFFLIVAALSSCQVLGDRIGGQQKSQEVEEEPDQEPAQTPTPAPLGSVENPLILGIVTTQPETTGLSAEDLARLLTDQSGYEILARIFPDYTSLVNEMSEGLVHIAWLPPLTYLYAHQNEFADVALLTNHFGVYQYGSQFLANTDSGFTSFFEPQTNQNTGEAETALRQFDGKRPCWVEPQSISGYIAPKGLLAKYEVNTLDGVIAQTTTAVIRALYVKEVCDFGVTFSVLGDPRTASTVQQDLTDVMSRIVIIWRSDPIIPNLNLSFQHDLPDPMRQKITSLLLDLVKTEEGKTALTTITEYDIQDLKPIEDSIYDPLREVVEFSGVKLETVIGK